MGFFFRFLKSGFLNFLNSRMCVILVSTFLFFTITNFKTEISAQVPTASISLTNSSHLIITRDGHKFQIIAKLIQKSLIHWFLFVWMDNSQKNHSCFSFPIKRGSEKLAPGDWQPMLPEATGDPNSSERNIGGCCKPINKVCCLYTTL